MSEPRTSDYMNMKYRLWSWLLQNLHLVNDKPPKLWEIFQHRWRPVFWIL